MQRSVRGVGLDTTTTTATASLTATPLPSASSTTPPTLTPSLTPDQTATVTSTPACTTLWNVVASPNVGLGGNYLTAVDTIAADNIWAVGYYTSSLGLEQALIEQWDGRRWTVVSGVNTNGNSRLLGVVALAANDLWAVGYQQPVTATRPLTLILHWNGSQWNQMPNAGRGALNAVTAITTSDIWAVGTTDFFNQAQTLILHWDGQAWQTIPSPKGDPTYNTLNGVAALTTDDVWAVGTFRVEQQLLAEHWDGQAWSIVPVPNPCCFDNEFHDVIAFASNNIWAVGNGSWQPQYSIEYQWDGSTWHDYAAIWAWYYNKLYSVAAAAPDDMWAVGVGFPRGMLITHWNGQQWQAVTTPPNPNITVLYGVAAVTANDAWTVGYDGFYNGMAKQTATLHYTGACTTPTPTVTPCPVQFTDVPSGSTFYPYVRCLACRGIVSGYPCGGPGEPCPGAYYRPGNNVTRGQAAKLIGLSAGFQEPVTSTQQTFEDVAPGTTFWPYVERLAGRGIIGGYPCGGPGEPCVGPTNRPYFRPNNNMTRGQAAKVVANAVQFADQIPSTQQTFADVPSNQVFWLAVERMVAHGVLGGYPCGGAGEPCDTRQRPYFRLGTSVTRGQIAKIVANTFFPDCQTP